jgi:inorganic pyrophosphatase
MHGDPLFPGVLVRCRAIGMFKMTDEMGGDDKVLAVPFTDPRLEHLRDIHHLPEFDRLEIQHFFEVYKELEPGKSVEGASWVGRVEAENEITRSRQRFLDAGGYAAAH